MKLSRLVVSLLLVFWAASPAAALTEEEAVAHALRANLELRALRKRAQLAEGEIISAGALENPSLRLEVLHLQETDPARVGFGVALQWTPPQPLERAARRAGARAGMVATQQDIAEQEWALAAAVRGAHLAAREYAEQLTLLDQALGLRRRVAALVRARVDRGAATRLEHNLAALAMLRAQRERDEAELRGVQAQSQLKALLCYPSAEPLVLTGESRVQEAEGEPDAEALIGQALALRPGLRAARARVEGAAQGLKREQARRWPWLSITGRYRHNDASGYPRDGQLSLDLTLPVLNQNQGPLRVAEAEQARLQATAEAQAEALRQRVYAACAELRVHRGVLRRFRAELLPILEEHERLMATAARGAEVDLVALLGAEEGVLRGRREHSEARLAYARARLALASVVSGPYSIDREVSP